VRNNSIADSEGLSSFV